MRVTATGSEGLAAILEARPAVAVVDIGLPGLDGLEIAARVRQEAGRGIRLVALSGYGQPEDRARAEAAGFDAYLTKSVDVDALLETLA